MEIISIIQLNYGFTKKQAVNYYKTLTKKQVEFLLEGYKKQCKQAFYND